MSGLYFPSNHGGFWRRLNCLLRRKVHRNCTAPLSGSGWDVTAADVRRRALPGDRIVTEWTRRDVVTGEVTSGTETEIQ